GFFGSCFFFFFQAEDGIRDFHVTGVQTCALPILSLFSSASLSETMVSNSLFFWSRSFLRSFKISFNSSTSLFLLSIVNCASPIRSEERRVGKECRSRCSL